LAVWITANESDNAVEYTMCIMLPGQPDKTLPHQVIVRPYLFYV